jgi:hypothetical protein
MPNRSGLWIPSTDPSVIHSPRLTGLTLDVESIMNHLHPVSDITFLS